DAERSTATVSAGTRWRDVIEAAAPYGLAPLNGSSAGVGVVGYTLGGGMGPMGRTFGFAADHVRRLQIVVADGTVLEVDADHEPELFWALRGGKCDIGIVTELEFALMPVAQYYRGRHLLSGCGGGDGVAQVPVLGGEPARAGDHVGGAVAVARPAGGPGAVAWPPVGASALRLHR
ncbi:MAG TPA: FAD-binding protein, partial [Mycobacterium sp.]|nr:FAD-binding protein [Mycobacterium sp.]